VGMRCQETKYEIAKFRTGKDKMKKIFIIITVVVGLSLMPHNVIGISISDIKELNNKEKPDCKKIETAMLDLKIKDKFIYKFKFDKYNYLNVWVDNAWYAAKDDEKLEYIIFFSKYAQCSKPHIRTEHIAVVVYDANTNKEIAHWSYNRAVLE
jgi:hypothetical protein